LLFAAALGIGCLWSYWPTLSGMAHCWATDPQYSHGFLVPIFALFVLAARRPATGLSGTCPSWWGIPWLLLAGVLRLAGAGFYFDFLDALSLLPLVTGLIVLFGGWPALRRAWPAVAFLIFMLPLPYAVEVALAQPLQRMATLLSTYVLQTVGVPALAEGNVIVIERVKLGVVEACSGLGMLVTFFALSAAVALVLSRPWTDRLVVFASAVPIAIFANVWRIALTGWLSHAVGERWAHMVWHDLAGWLMMPLALALLWLELKYLDRLLPPEAPPGPVAFVAVRDDGQATTRSAHSRIA
jgi:exosortase